MSANASLIRHSQLLGRLVLDRATTETLGHMAALWVDPKAARVLGLVIRSGQLPIGGTLRACAWSQLMAIGDDSVLVDLGPTGDPLQQPDGAFDLMGHELWSDDGNRVGTVVDWEFAPDDGRVERYIFRRESAPETGYAIAAATVISGGPKRLMVQAAAAETAEPAPLPAESWDTALTSVQTSVQSTLRQVQEKAKPLAENARNRFSDLARETRDRAKTIAETARSRATEISETVRDRADRLVHDVQSPARDRPAGDLPAAAEAEGAAPDPIETWDEEPPAIDTPAKAIDPEPPQTPPAS